MKKVLTISFLVFGLLTCVFSARAQQKNEAAAKQALKSFYRQSLQLDSAKAEQVALVQEQYKASMKAAMADSSLSEASRRSRYQQLMDNKNQQLRKLLSPVQQEKMIPSSERVQPPAKKD